MFGFFKRRKLIELQKLVMPGCGNRLVMSERQLYSWANNICSQKLKTLNDCANLVNTTIKPDVFFQRYDLLYEYAYDLAKFEPYVKFRGTPPSRMAEQFDETRPAAIMNFIERSYEATRLKAQSLKTEKGRSNKFIMYFASLQPYYDDMGEEAVQYLNSLKDSMLCIIN